MKRILLILLLALFANALKALPPDSLEKNQKHLKKFMKELEFGEFVPSVVYFNYFYIPPGGIADRSDRDLAFYNDTLLKEISWQMANGKFSIYELREASRKFPSERVFAPGDPEDQAYTYIIAIRSKEGTKIYHALVRDEKIRSLMPREIRNGKVISWR